MTGIPAELTGLAAEFPGYEFATQQTWGGISIIARRHGGCARPGLYAVVTDDPDQLFARATAAGAEVLQGLHETNYGSRDFAVRDPEGNRWSFGTYRGEPRQGPGVSVA